MKMNNPVLILGAGISGLGAAYKLSCNGRQTVVLERILLMEVFAVTLPLTVSVLTVLFIFPLLKMNK